MKPNPKLDEILKDVFEPLPELQMEATRLRVLRRLRSERRVSELPMSEAPLSGARSFRGWRFAAVAASVLLAIAAGMVFTGLFLNSASAMSMGTAGAGVYRVVGQDVLPIPEGTPIQRGVLLRASDNSNGVVTLSDGSHVEMRSSTELSVDRAADGVSIHLTKGDVIVNAAKQHQGQLHVQTQDVTVSVAGTVFLVKAEKKGSQVAVIEGEVHVQQGITGKKLIRGEQVSSNPEIEPMPVKDEIAWSQDLISHLALLQIPVYTLEEVKPGTVIGVVRIHTGNPAAGIRVTATRADVTGTTLRPVTNVATTDESGRFRIENLPPGNYYLAAGRSDLPTYFPGTLEIAKGTIISVRSAAILSDINFAVREVSIPLTTPPLWQEPGNIALILAPVDAEPGRGNGEIEIQTATKTNRFTGRVTWNVQQTQPVGAYLNGTTLKCFSVFGAVKADGSPFTQADCPNGTAIVPATPQSETATSEPRNRWVTGFTYVDGLTNSSWWSNKKILNDLQLSDDQRQKIDAARMSHSPLFSKNTAEMAKEEVVLKRMIAPGSSESNLVPQQEERVLQLRKSQEEAIARLDQEMVQILTEAQRTQLQSLPQDDLRLNVGRRVRILPAEK